MIRENWRVSFVLATKHLGGRNICFWLLQLQWILLICQLTLSLSALFLDILKKKLLHNTTFWQICIKQQWSSFWWFTVYHQWKREVWTGRHEERRACVSDCQGGNQMARIYWLPFFSLHLLLFAAAAAAPLCLLGSVCLAQSVINRAE